MVWGAFSSECTLDLQFTSSRMNSSDYIDVLENSLLPFLEANREVPYIFQQDNARIHVSRETNRFFTNCSIQIMEWPACSPDLNPIENIWGILVRRVYADNRQFSHVEELKTAILNEWNNLEAPLLKTLADSMKKRLFEVAKVRGSSINY